MTLRHIPILVFLVLAMLAAAGVALAAPLATISMDLRTGEVYQSKSPDTRLHPASLTKMMTLYLAFEAIETGRISPDQIVTISGKAASEPPSRLGLRAGDHVEFRHLIRAAAVKSANDAATAIGEAIDGSEARFVRRMNKKAQALGMTRTTFRNANGLTHPDHLSTVRDIATLARHLYFDYPNYFHIFSKTRIDAGRIDVNNTNRLFLTSYPGATGLKTGFTNAAGYNIAATAERNGRSAVAVVFGAASSTERAGAAGRLLDVVFRKSPGTVAVNRPTSNSLVVMDDEASATDAGRKVAGAVERSLRPKPRPGADGIVPPGPVATASGEPMLSDPPTINYSGDVEIALQEAFRPAEETVRQISVTSEDPDVPFGIDIGGFSTRYQAEKVLLEVALSEVAILGRAGRDIGQTRSDWRGRFVNLTRQSADLACARLQARGRTCRAYAM